MFTEKAKENLLAMLEQAKISAVDNTDAQALLALIIKCCTMSCLTTINRISGLRKRHRPCSQKFLSQTRT